MFFLIAFGWLVAASFAFLLAILTPNWLSFEKTLSATDYTIQRGIFFVCDLLPSNSTYKTTQCVSIIDQTSSTDSNKWMYEFAIACAALAIACASLSIIAIWFSGIYFHVRRRTNRTLCFLFLIGLEVFLAFCTSLVVWILLISETARLGVSINRFMFEWPMWLAVGASGGYLMSFITIIISYCTIRRRGNKMERDYDPPRNHF